MCVKIITDSTADLPHNDLSRIITVPLTIRFGQEEYVDGISISKRQFYEKLVETDVLPATSQASPETFAQIFRKVHAAGDTAVVITLSSKLSGTYQSACIAAADFPGEIFVVDSKTVTIGSGILVRMALDLVQAGWDAPAISQELTRQRENIRLVAMLDTLEYLKKGGRISKSVAFAGELLSIKPVVCIDDGAVALLGKARGSRQGNNLLARQIEKSGGIDFSKPLLLGYTGLSDVLLQKYISDSAALWQDHVQSLSSVCIGSVVGTHVGPGAVAIAFFCQAGQEG